MKQYLISALLTVVGFIISLHGHSQNYFPILQYHHVGEKTPFSTSVTPEQLQEHMDYLEKENFHVIDLVDALEKIQKGIALPEKSVAITFDDAYLNIYQNGFPIIKEKGFPFTVFINTQPVEWKSKKFLSWDNMREMQQHKVVFANHTVSHPYMLRLEEGESKEAWQERMQQEIRQVETLLEKELGSSPKMIAYPYGESNVTIREIVSNLGMVGFGQQSGVVSIDSDFTNLPRYPASGHYAKLSGLKTKLASLPMPLEKVENDGDLANDMPVSMFLTFKSGKYRFKDLACYVSGQGKATLEWLDDKKVKVMAKQKFKYGRGRINCTMPSMKNGQFHWFSNVWIRPKASQGYIQ
ncbi:polysaccharide deacetylase [Marinomonas agarivorans]|nr:polysaccharide deacetylase [Marinomonas agarivorans]